MDEEEYMDGNEDMEEEGDMDEDECMDDEAYKKEEECTSEEEHTNEERHTDEEEYTDEEEFCKQIIQNWASAQLRCEATTASEQSVKGPARYQRPKRFPYKICGKLFHDFYNLGSFCHIQYLRQPKLIGAVVVTFQVIELISANLPSASI
jgi:hypothetical protein